MQKLPRELQIFLATLTLLVVVLVWLNLPEFPPGKWPEFTLFLILISFASMFPIPDPRGGYITAAFVLFFVLIMVYGPEPALIIGGPAYAIGAAVSRRWLPWRTISNGAQMAISIWLAGTVFTAAGGSATQLDVRSTIIPLAAAILVYQTANNFLVSFYFSRMRGTPFVATWISDIRSLTLSNLLSIPIVLLLAYLYTAVHPLTLLLYLLALPFQRRAHQLQITQKQIFDQAIDALVVAIDAGFPQGAGHSRRVADTAVAIARQMGLSDSQVDTIEFGGLLHDVGLLGLDEVLTDDVSNEEASEKLKQHVIVGANISRDLPQTGVAEIVLFHHEHFDGSGYTKGLAGRQIPIGARVVALAESFESRCAGGLPYGRPLSPLEAKDEIVSQSGKSFDPAVVRAFVAAFDSGAISNVQTEQIPSVRSLSAEGKTT